MKKLWILIPVLFLVACGGNEPAEETELFEMTIEELAVFDGQDGRKAYIAVDGFIYDVTNSDYWNNGGHNGYQAGQDLTQAIMSAPHGMSTLANVPKVGILIEEELKSVLQVIASIPGYESLASMIYSEQITIDFTTFDEVTIFLPSLEGFMSDAFDIPDGFNPEDGFEGLLTDVDLFDILRYHMVSQTLLEDALKDGLTEITSVQGETIQVSVVDGVVHLNDIPLLETDFIAENGVIHTLDGVLTPPSVDLSITVTYEGLEGDIISVQTLEIGDTLNYPTPLTYGGYTFVEWSLDATTVTQSVTIIAVYEKIYMTLEELSAFDGQNGQPAYILVDGVIYDVTNSSYWNNGGHNGYQAGQDLTQYILNVSPHGTSVLSRLPVVAFLRED